MNIINSSPYRQLGALVGGNITQGKVILLTHMQWERQCSAILTSLPLR